VACTAANSVISSYSKSNLTSITFIGRLMHLIV